MLLKASAYLKPNIQTVIEKVLTNDGKGVDQKEPLYTTGRDAATEYNQSEAHHVN